VGPVLDTVVESSWRVGEGVEGRRMLGVKALEESHTVFIGDGREMQDRKLLQWG
jgi:hypothetical protein